MPAPWGPLPGGRGRWRRGSGRLPRSPSDYRMMSWGARADGRAQEGRRGWPRRKATIGQEWPAVKRDSPRRQGGAAALGHDPEHVGDALAEPPPPLPEGLPVQVVEVVQQRYRAGGRD